jgi:hypothetical protein
MLSKDQKCCWGADQLHAFGFNGMLMKGCDALFFYQLLLFPIEDPKRSAGVNGSRQMPYYTEVTGFTNIYGALEFGMAGTYASLDEMVKFEGVFHQGGGLGTHLH